MEGCELPQEKESNTLWNGEMWVATLKTAWGDGWQQTLSDCAMWSSGREGCLNSFLATQRCVAKWGQNIEILFTVTAAKKVLYLLR